MDPHPLTGPEPATPIMTPVPSPEPAAQNLGQIAASQLGGGNWELDAEVPLEGHDTVAEAPAPAAPTTGPRPPRLASPPPAPSEPPPTPEQIIEAMLFVGGPPLTADVVCAAIRGLTREGFQEAIELLTRKYRRQNRPYTIEPRGAGVVLTLTPAHRGLRERLFGGPREARLTQPALDVLSVVAYRQPVGKAEIDATRGTDSGGVLRQLVRLGLIAVQHRAEAGAGGREVRYGTTPRFLQVFGLASLDELPRLGDTQQA